MKAPPAPVPEPTELEFVDLGFPPFRGGPFRYVDAVGAGEALKRIQGYEQQHGKRWTPTPVLVE
jgi:3-hydroxyacyl-CoA dehydrogenase / enoyl-CoA hydratase / 3-hydroxybutyryl-CoA epimerase